MARKASPAATGSTSRGCPTYFQSSREDGFPWAKRQFLSLLNIEPRGDGWCEQVFGSNLAARVGIRPPARDARDERQRPQVNEHVPRVAEHDRIVAPQPVLRSHLDGGFDGALAHPNP